MNGDRMQLPRTCRGPEPSGVVTWTSYPLLLQECLAKGTVPHALCYVKTLSPPGMTHLFAAEILIDGLDEHLWRPGRIIPEPGFVLVRVAGFSGFDLLESHSLFDRILNAIADDRYHIPVLENVMFVAKPAVPGDHHGAAFLQVFGHSDFEHFVKTLDDAVDGPAMRHVDIGKASLVEDLSRGHDVGLSEPDHRIAGSIRGRNVHHDDRLIVRIHVLGLARISIRRPAIR